MMAREAKTKGNQTDFAKLLIELQLAASKMIKACIVKVEPDGKILLEQAGEDWQTKVNVSQQRPLRWKGPKTAAYFRNMEPNHQARTDREAVEAALRSLSWPRGRGF